MRKGDIVLVPFPFTDLSGSKIRPALVLVGQELDVTVAFITSKTNLKEQFFPCQVLSPDTVEMVLLR
jgi:mRNA interferase MazF